MTTFETKLQEWIVDETSFLSEKCITDIPDVSKLSLLKEGKNKNIWDYILTHVRSKCTVLKVKRILQLKRDQTNPEKLFPKPVNGVSKLRQEIKNAEDKQKFLKNSVSNVKKAIVSTELDLRNILQEIDKMNQKTALLHLITLHYQEKTTLVNSLHGRLSLHLKDGVYKQNTNIFPLNIEASARKSYPPLEEIIPRVKNLLEQTESLVVKKFEKCPGVTALNFNLQKMAIEIFKGVLMTDLLFNLREQSKTSCMNLIKRLSQERNTLTKSMKSFSLRDSEKLLQELKFNHININFSVKKVKNDISRLASEKGSLLMTKINPFSDDTEYQSKCLLLDKIAENAGLRESISHLEQILSEEQTKVNVLKKINADEIILNEDIVAIQNKFYTDLYTMCLLLNSVPSVLDYIGQRIVDTHKYANEDLYLNMSSVLQEFPHELGNELRFENEALWNVLRKNDIIKSMVQGSETMHQFVPESFWNLVDVTPFQNLMVVCQNVKLLKDFIASSEKYDWEYDEKGQSNACEQYDKMMNMLQKMEIALNACEDNLDMCLNYRNNIQTALQEWWEQNAQFIPDIEYDNKTLKMWIDIVNAADDLV